MYEECGQPRRRRILNCAMMRASAGWRMETAVLSQADKHHLWGVPRLLFPHSAVRRFVPPSDRLSMLALTLPYPKPTVCLDVDPAYRSWGLPMLYASST